jgi:molecular chaperone DnaK (HSP70)
MVGDCIRTPIFQQIIKDTFNLEVSKTLAPDEAVARGSTLFVGFFNNFLRLQ